MDDILTNTALQGHSSQVNFIQAGQPDQPLAGIKKGPPRTVAVEDYIGFLLSAGLSFLP